MSISLKKQDIIEYCKKLKNTVLMVLGGFQAKIAKLASLNGFTASLYYTFFSTQFYREHQAVLSSVLLARDQQIGTSAVSGQLRRNIHRIEKGLIMRPRRRTFAGDYIEETITLLEKSIHLNASDETRWAFDVLDTYFLVVDTEAKSISTAFTSYTALNTRDHQNQGENHERRIPFNAAAREESEITFDQLHSLYMKRKSVRWFLNQSVSIDLLYKAINISVLSPTACNRLPFKFHVFANKEAAVEIAKLAGGTSGFSDNIQSIIAVVGDLSCYPYERDRHIIYIDASLAAMQLMLALETLDLATCSINWPDVHIREKQIAAKLNLDNNQRVVMLMAVGYADPEGQVPYSQKKSNDEIVTVQ